MELKKGGRSVLCAKTVKMNIIGEKSGIIVCLDNKICEK